ncbi:hypothetical protein T4A_3153 [Trichinella pseudospiralis]|uniref:Uncharacterized protein n=1 Tax=Trichinella pseudospiralis TaxID=6337 RepID=A0A0V1ESX7_TRIPS|nr:hypothetical protein T4E_9635 [Trichinella pseudospiralis]KRY76910.1 hypothetical protein T4A_3153 [Trichinella pseudospiralis]
MDCFDCAMLPDLNIPPEAWKPKEGIPFCEGWDYAEVSGEGDVELIRVLWNRMTAQFIYDLYCAICVPAMEYDPVLSQFVVPSVLLTSVIECISENFINFDLQEIFTANDLLSHKVHAWYAVLKLFDSIYECLCKEEDLDKGDRVEGETVAKVEISSAKDDKDLQVAKKIAPSRTKSKPRSVIYSPRLQYLRQKRMRDYRRKTVAAMKSDERCLLSDLKAIQELNVCNKLLLDSAVKRRHYLNSLKKARISCHNIQWRHRQLKAQVVRMKANLENELHKKQLLINDFKDKISRKLLHEMSSIEEKDFTL